MTFRLLASSVLLVVLAGCASPPAGEQPAAGPTEAPAQPTAEQTPRPVEIAVPAQLDFTLPALDGGQVVGAELAGKHVALWFWTPW